MGVKDFINTKIELVKNVIDKKKIAAKNFEILKNNSTALDNLIDYECKNSFLTEARNLDNMEMCLTLNLENSKLIDQLIPIDEVILDIKMATEAHTNIQYIFVLTDKCVYVLNKNKYRKFNYGDINEMHIVNKALFTQGVNFNGMAFFFEGSEIDINNFITIATNDEVRLTKINEKRTYLCGINPILQYRNREYVGISLSEKGDLVLHNGKTDNKKVYIKDIEYVQLLMDKSMVLTKGKNIVGQVSAHVPCRKMTLRFVCKDAEYYIDVMKENSMASLVQKEDSKYQDALDLAKKIIDTIEKYTSI